MNERNTLMCSHYVMNITKQCYDDRHTSNAWIPSSLLRNENELGDSSVLSTFRMHFEHFNSDTMNNSQQIMDLTTTRLFSTKWLMVFSKDEEVTFENELLVQLLMKNQHFNLQVMRDAMMPHIYPFFEYYFPEARNAMIRLFHWMDCDGSLRV